MLGLAIISLAAGGWFYASALFQNRGYAWADATCTSMPIFCGSPSTVLTLAIGVAVILFIVHTVQSS